MPNAQCPVPSAQCPVPFGQRAKGKGQPLGLPSTNHQEKRSVRSTFPFPHDLWVLCNPFGSKAKKHPVPFPFGTPQAMAMGKGTRVAQRPLGEGHSKAQKATAYRQEAYGRNMLFFPSSLGLPSTKKTLFFCSPLLSPGVAQHEKAYSV